MTARLLLILGAIACADQPEPQERRDPRKPPALLKRGSAFFYNQEPAHRASQAHTGRGTSIPVEHRHFRRG